MQNLVPHFILEKYNLGESGGKFQAASLFADISGFSAATHALMAHGSEAAEAMSEIMLSIFGPLVEQIHAQGGFITTFAGDAFTALFTTEDDDSGCLRALAAATAIQQHMISHPVQNTPFGSFPFAIKLGLGEGEVEWGILCPENDLSNRAQKAVYFFSGPGVESAAAAEHHAQSGTLVLSPGLYAQVKTAIKGLALVDGYWRCLSWQTEPPGALPFPQRNILSDAETAFIPASIHQRDTRGDFRQVVSVFIQLQGIDTRQDLDIFMQAIFDLLHQFDGYLNRLDFGDKGCNLLLFWGMPVSHEDDFQRALEFVLELGNHTPGSFRAGLTYSPMYAGLSGSEARGEYTCYGDGINLAARLMIAAPWGNLWLDECLAARARARFVTEYVDHLTFKGFAEKQPVHALLERRPPGENFFGGRLIGRQVELVKLSAFVQPLFAETGEQRFAGLLVLVGEAGLGKSRLVHELLTSEYWPVTGKAQVFTCQADQVMHRPFNPFQYWLQRYFDQSPSQSVERNKRAFGRKLDGLLGSVGDQSLAQELNRTRSCLGALVNLTWDSSLYSRLDPKGRYDNTLQALKALLKAESLRQPVVLVIEDAQWLDADSQAFIQMLGREIQSYPLALLATARPERDGDLFGPGLPYQQVELAGLSETELAALAADHLGGPVTPKLCMLLAERAGSNPFFIEQILLYLREQGRLAQAGGQWDLVGGDVGAALPDQVRAIFIARVDRLAKEIQGVVQAAAVLGREFEVRILAQMLRDQQPAHLGLQVAHVEQEHIWSALSQLRYLFKHALLRDAVYEMQLKTRRRNLHRLAAEALEKVYAIDLDARSGELAYHYEAACNQGLKSLRPQAVHALEVAGNRAAERFENRASLDYFSRALALLNSDENSTEDIELRLRLLLAREGVYHLLGEREPQRADLTTLETLIRPRQRPAEQAELRLRQARLANVTGDYAEGQSLAQAAADTARVAGDLGLESRAQKAQGEALWGQSSYVAAAEHIQFALELADAGGLKDLRADGLLMLGTIGLSRSDYDHARAYYEQCLSISREIGDQRRESRALNGLGIVFTDQRDFVTGRQCYEQSLVIIRQTGDRMDEGLALGNLGMIFAAQNDYLSSCQYYEQSLAVKREIGDRHGEGATFYNLGLLFTNQGDTVAACQYYEQALVILLEIGERRGQCLTLNNLGIIFANQDDYATACQYFDQALAIQQEIGEKRSESLTLFWLGTINRIQGNLSVAQNYYEQSLALLRELHLVPDAAETLTGLAENALAQNDLVAARVHVLEVLTILDANPNLVFDDNYRPTLLGCGRVLLALGDSRGQAILSETYARMQEQAACMDEAARRIFLENVPANRELCTLMTKLQSEKLADPLASTPQFLQAAFEPAVQSESVPVLLDARTEIPQPQPVPALDRLSVPPVPTASTQPSAIGLDKQALAAQIIAMLGQTAQSQGVTLVILGDIHIDQIVLGGQPVEMKGIAQAPNIDKASQ